MTQVRHWGLIALSVAVAASVGPVLARSSLPASPPMSGAIPSSQRPPSVDSSPTDILGARSFARESDQHEEDAETAVLASRAREDGLGKNPAVVAKVQLAIDGVLAQAERDHLYASAVVTDDDVKQVLLSDPGAYDEYALRHIFIAVGLSRSGVRRSEHDAFVRATWIKGQLDAGADFSTLARAESDDAATAEGGGELSPMLGMFVATQFLPAISRLHGGDISNPVRGEQGYHVIQVEQKTIADFDNRHRMIEAMLRDKIVDATIALWMKGLSDKPSGAMVVGSGAK